METKTNIYQYWIQYTTQNDEKFFWQFVSGFVDIWEHQSGFDFKAVPHWSEIKPDNVPSLAKLPDELLPAVGKFLYIAKDNTNDNEAICLKEIDQVNLLLRCLHIICRNFDNIPFIASCDYINLCVGITSKYLEKLLNKTAKTEEEIEKIKLHLISFCHFLEGLYDPYLTWRNFLLNEIADFSTFIYKPALLHVEVVPFIYDCFQTHLITLYPTVCVELLNVLGGIISGAQSILTISNSTGGVETGHLKSGNGHNALRSVCPATVCLIIKIISSIEADETIRNIALNCFIVMVQVLHKCTPEQRQIELSLILEMFIDSLKKVISGTSAKSDTSLSLIDNTIKSENQLVLDAELDKQRENKQNDDSIDTNKLSFMLCSALETTRRLLEDFESSRSVICQLMVDLNFINILILLPESVIELNLDSELLGVECIRTITILLLYSRDSKKKSTDLYDYDNIVSKWISVASPKRALLQEFVYMAMDGKRNSDSNAHLRNSEVIITLINNLHLMEEDDQMWMAQKISWLCTKDLRSKWNSCQKGAILAICKALSDYSDYLNKSAITLINLLDNLGCTSITSQELKQIILLLRPEKKFEYRALLIHTLSNITRHSENACKAFLNIQNESDGINVPDINKWTNTSYGFSINSWLCLSKLNETDDNSGKDRQLLMLTTKTGQGLDIYIDHNGSLIINVLKKNSHTNTSVPNTNLLDGKWHCLAISIAYARRALSNNQISVFIDGTQKSAVSLKFPSFDDVFTYCYIGCPISESVKNEPKKSEVEKESFHGTFVKNIFNNQFLPSIVLQAPSYLSFGTMGSKSNTSNLITTGQNSLNHIPLLGHIAHFSIFNDSLTTSAARWLYESGADCHARLCSDEGSDSQEMFNRLVFCYSALATWDGVCMNLANTNNFNGITSAIKVCTTSVKEVINALTNVNVLYPLMENVNNYDIGVDAFQTPGSPIADKSNQKFTWDISPTNSFTEWKMDQNPVSMFLTLLKNCIVNSHLNQEELLKHDGVTVIGNLLCQCDPSLIDVNVLMAVQLLSEIVKEVSNEPLLKSIYQNILLNFKIWSRSPFHIRIGHVQYLSNLVKQDRLYFRKNFGIQYVFDILRTYYIDCEDLNIEDAKAIRLALLSIIKYMISKDLNINELICILGFLESVKYEMLLIETLEMLISQMESKNCKDQIFLLLHEKYTGETLYVLLLNRSFSVQFKTVLVKFLLTVVRTNRVHLRNKTTMLLQHESHSMFPGLITYIESKSLNLKLTSDLFDLMAFGDTKAGYAGVLALLHCLAYENIDIKLELARKLLASTFINLNVPFLIAKQSGWQDCIARLLVKRCISESSLVEEAIDLMTFDEESLKLEADSSYHHHTQIHSLSDAANVLENEIKEIAGSVSEAVSDNLHYAADNLTSAVSSVYSVIRQKTVDIQETLGELGQMHRSYMPSFQEDFVELSLDSQSLTHSIKSTSSVSNEDLNVNDYSIKLQKDLPESISDGLEKCVNKEENLCYLVSNILFTILWRGVEGFSKESWKERGQVMACINLLALNNELYCSHLQLRLRLLEMGVQAALADFKDSVQSAVSYKANSLNLMRLIYDLVVLDPNKDETKKCSSKLLDGVLGLLDALKVFLEDDADPTKREFARLGLGILIACAGGGSSSGNSNRAALTAPACALLHSLLRATGSAVTGDVDSEAAHILCAVSAAMKQSIENENNDQYSFLLPVMKALLEKVHDSMNLAKYLPNLPKTNVGPVFFNDFQTYIQEEEWSHFIEFKVRPLSIAYDRETNTLVGEPLNTFWAECFEACKSSSQARAKEQLQSKSHFQNQVISSFKTWQMEDLQRYSSVLMQQKGRETKAANAWASRKAFLKGPRGAWATGNYPERFWRLSPHENLSRMRLKLEPGERPEDHEIAARLRDNLGRGGSSNSQGSSTLAPPTAIPATAIGIEDGFPEDEFRMSLEPEIQSVEIGKEKMVVSQECELVTLMTKVKGRLDVTTSCLYFHDLSSIKDNIERQDFTIALSQLREIHLRRYNLRRSALEIFLIDQTNYFLNFTTKTRNSVFTRILSLQPPNILYGSGQSPAELLKASGLTQKWVNREITNFDYLMHLNTIAGRTYNDLSQYPVFPWILADYHSETLDLENPASFRDLSKPIGVVNPKNEAEVQAKYDNFEDPGGIISKFHYGTHYSNSAGVLHYLLRVEPFTSLHIELQSGRFDVADRQFHSIAQTWKLLMNNPNDVKELTPEFFYFPEFLKNVNNLDLGILQGTNHQIGNVELPPWAEGKPENFIYLHRRALESDYVSENLNNWIDLIFGYKQKGPRAIDALNVFYYCSYEGAVDLDAIKDAAERAAVEGMIANFGQTPAQLIKNNPHPQRLTVRKMVSKALRGETRMLDCLQLLSHLIVTGVQIAKADDPLIWLGGPCRGRGFLQAGGRWLAAISRNGFLHSPNWQPQSQTGQVLEAESTSATMKARRQIPIICKKGTGIDNKVIAMTSDGKTIYTGGHWDSSIKIYAITSKVKLQGSVIRHFGVVTCLALDSCSEHWLVSGSEDSTLTVWEIGSSSNILTPKHSLCGHDAPVTCVAVMAELDAIVSGSEDGTVNVYNLKKGEFVHTLKPEGCRGTHICIKFIVLSHQGNISFIVNDQIYNSVHVFTINGKWKASRNVCGRVTSLCAIGDCILIADDAGDITISTSHELKPVYDIPLHVPIEHVLITPNNTHILVALRDGKVAIIGLPPPNKNVLIPAENI